MARFFNAQAALAKIQGDPIHPIHTIPNVSEPENRTNSTNRVPPNNDAFEERAAIAEFDGGLMRCEAEQLAAQAQGFDNVVAFYAAQAKSKSRPSHET